jgi:NitT/TauT family transport system substrate-binding protein
VVASSAGIQTPEDFRGKKVATPQLGNTQDLALRAWLQAHNLKPREKGGDVQIIPIANPDQLTLFLKKEIDAAWAPEPWASRLIHEAGGRLFLDERELWPQGQFATALLVVRTGFLREHPDVVKKWIRTHVELSAWINSNRAEAKRLVNQEIAKETGHPLSEVVLADSFSRLQPTNDPLRTSLLTSARWSFELGFLGREQPNLSGLCDLSILNEVLRERKEKPRP